MFDFSPQEDVYEVITVSDRFFEILKDIPEAAMAESITIRGEVIEGPKKIIISFSLEEIINKLPDIIEKMVDAKHTNLRIIHRKGYCFECSKIKNRPKDFICPHIVEGKIPTINKSWDIDIEEFLKKNQTIETGT